MMSLLEFLVIWFSIDVVVLVTGWYAVFTIRPRFSDWWKQHIVDEPKLEQPKLTHLQSGI
jgi:hypothetical protein